MILRQKAMLTKTGGTPLLAALLFVAPLASAQPTIATAQVVAHWRAKVHARNVNQATEQLAVTESNEDGIPGHIRECLASGDRYKRETKREFDDAEVVITKKSSERRDWNGFLRRVEGEELRRLRAQIFETQTLL